MHTCSIWRLIAFTFIVIAAIAAQAEVPVSLDFSINVPDSFLVMDPSAFVDYDHDGYDDLLFRSASQVAVYSVHLNDVLFFYRYVYDTVQKKYADGYMDDDRAIDICEVIITKDSVRQQIRAIPHLSSDGYAVDDTLLICTIDTTQLRYLSQAYMYDRNHDGFDELYGSYYFVDTDWSYPPIIVNTHYTYFKYDYLDSSYEERTWLPRVLTEFHYLFEDNQPIAVLFPAWSYYTPASHGIGSSYSASFSFIEYLNDSAIMSTGFSVSGDTCTVDNSSGANMHWIQAIGVLASSPSDSLTG